MYLDIDTKQERTDVREVDDLKRFSVRAADQSDHAALARALSLLGYFDEQDNAWIDIEALRGATGRADDPDWSSQFDAMVAYAASKGWVDDAGTSLRAHLESESAGDGS